MILQELFEGCKTHRGVLGSIVNGSKKAWSEPQPFDWKKHLSGEQTQGLSPVDTLTGKVLWIALDVDLGTKPEVFCKNIFANLGTQYFCFGTMGGKWRIVEFLEDWTDVNEARDRVKQLEKQLERECGYKADSGHSLPHGYDIEEGKPGHWIFMPYHNEDTKCYSPSGHKLTKEQFEFRAKYRDIPVVVASVGMIGKGKEGSRHKALFVVALTNRHFGCEIDLNELNKNFNKPIIEKLDRDISHATS